MSWDKEIEEMGNREALAFEMGGAEKAVSYTHLTLPTILRV